MIKHVIVKGLCYGNETAEDMLRRERMMEEDNRRVDELYADWERQRKTPIPSMIPWCKQRGLL